MNLKINTNTIFLVLTLFCSLLLLGLSIKGNKDSFFQNEFTQTAPGSPLESSNSTSRYVLTQAIAERGTFALNKEEARLASPDVAKHDGKYISLFMPGVSLLAVPFYKFGQLIGHAQIGTYSINIILALLDGILIYQISQKLTGKKLWSIIAGFCFIFATNLWPYALTLTQHPLSSFLILCCLRLLLQDPSVIANVIIGSLFGIGLLADFPNAIFLSPIILMQLSKHFNVKNKKINFKFLFMGLGLLPLITFFVFYNVQTAGSPFSAAQFLGRTTDFFTQDSLNQITTTSSAPRKGIQLPFKTRNLVQGLTVLLTSDERGWLYYSPLVGLCLIGMFVALKKSENKSIHKVILSILGLNILTYSMFGDPWGGWSFGPRYLIPGTALIFIYLPYFFELKINKFVLGTIFLIVTAYSVNLSSLGALTTSNVPPKQEAVHLLTPIPYTPKLNENFIQTQTSSLFYNLNLSNKLKPIQYQQIIFLLTMTFIILLTGYAIHKQD